ncbi:hypothetical protein [Vibrio lentus]|uniref:hypothetical protein n=1 Tax=Vibrio lentus TaxID=136468 RepID=UPI0039A77DB2
MSQPMQEAYAQATYYESVAPSLHPSKEEQQPLLDLQQAKFDSKEEMLNEASQMKEAMQSDTVQAMVESKAQDNHEYPGASATQHVKSKPSRRK